MSENKARGIVETVVSIMIKVQLILHLVSSADFICFQEVCFASAGANTNDRQRTE